MTRTTLSVFAMTALVLMGLGGASAQAEPFAYAHPRQAEVIGRADHQIARVRQERAEGEIGAFRAHRLIGADRRVIRQDRRMARVNGGYITRGQQRFMNHEENRVGGRIPT